MIRNLQNLGAILVAYTFLSLGLLALDPVFGQSGEAVAQDSGSFRAGAAMSNITPPLGQPIVGGWSPMPATHVHDELHARCLVLDDGTTTLAIVLCDNVGIPREVFDAAKERAEVATGLSSKNMLMAATHTHSATSARGSNPLVTEDSFSDYQRFLARRIADVIQIALQRLEPAEIGWGSVDVPTQVFNRRWLMEPGDHLRNPFGGMDQARMNPPRLSDALIEPAGPTDPEVAFLSVRSLEGRPIALLANYSLHYVGGVPANTISADYFGVFADRIQELLDADRQFPPFVGMMSNGTSGDINNNNYGAPAGERREPFEKMREVAFEVADAVFQAHQDISFHSFVPLAAAQRELVLETRKPSPELVSWAQEVLDRPEDAEQNHPRERTYAERTLRMNDSPDEVSILLQTLRIGDVGIAAIPFEVFAEIGLEIKETSPFDQTFTIELANGSYGYLPTPRQHELGGYETWLGTNRVEIEASTKIVETIQSLFAQLSE